MLDFSGSDSQEMFLNNTYLLHFFPAAYNNSPHSLIFSCLLCVSYLQTLCSYFEDVLK
ncbi:hypothetical protein PAHAL_5G219800 [Panicum hallii]|uniref:Uncharacterized protein n=1 Tax=Panicum hallii TaxID=206008 RepID=A0A2T8IKT7_9POAL|nr:hypothetical protein PAHAL_5G219800 [Panicum hallii]